MSAARVLSLCPGVWDHEALAGPAAAGYEVRHHGEELVDSPTPWDALRFDVWRWVGDTAARFRDARIDGVVGSGDYPGCMLAALVAEELGLPTPPAKLVVLLSNKYYSRVLQRSIVPEATPEFEAIDPLAGPFSRRRAPRLGFPLFVKPVKGTMSIRAQRADDARALDEALTLPVRERLGKFLLLRPYDALLRRFSDGKVPAYYFIGETPLTGHQVTVDGFVERGRCTIMGIVDSVMYPGTSSFRRFEYPSSLPAAVQHNMSDIVKRLMEGVGYDASCFNVELFWDEATDAVRIIEINPRMSYQFGDLYARVDGTHTWQVQLALATGRAAPWRAGAGRDGAAASFVLRRFRDGRVVRVPTPAELAALQQRFPGTTVKVLCAVGERLSDHDQDVGSWRFAIVNMSAPTKDELHARWHEAERMLHFAFAD